MKRNILVTGGNRGIGLAIVKKLSQNSDDTIILGTRNPKESIQLPENVFLRWCDLNEVENSIEGLQEEFSHFDVLVNNGAILNQKGPLEISKEELEEVLRVNVMGAYNLMKVFLPHMIEKNYGRIINVSSGWGSFHDGLTGPFSYSFSKASLNALTLTLSKNLPSNVKVNSMCPGWVRTRMGGESAPRTPEEGADTAVWLTNIDEKGPNGGFFRDREEIQW